MSDHKHKWYVDGSHESDIGDNKGWADLGLICLNDEGCDEIASVMIKIDPRMILLEEH